MAKKGILLNTRLWFDPAFSLGALPTVALRIIIYPLAVSACKKSTLGLSSVKPLKVYVIPRVCVKYYVLISASLTLVSWFKSRCPLLSCLSGPYAPNTLLWVLLMPLMSVHAFASTRTRTSSLLDTPSTTSSSELQKQYFRRRFCRE